MRTTVDISDEVYEQLKFRAVSEKTSVKALICSAVAILLRMETTAQRPREIVLPLIGSSAPGTLKLNNKNIYEYLDL